MDWMLTNTQFRGAFASLGHQVGDQYQVNDDCLAKLCDILGKLSVEDRTLRNFRRAMGFAQVVKKDLLPLLVGAKDNTEIKDTTIKILLNLTVPVECLLHLEVMLKTDIGRYTVMELNMLLSSSKEAFICPQNTKAVIEHMKTILEKEEKLSPGDCESISNCLLLLRNILHIPEHRLSANTVSMQNQILWNMFAQNVDKVLIQLMTSNYKTLWGVSIVQLIALMYKDQQAGTLQKLLSLWFESSLSDSSEGNESNTSPQHQGSGDSGDSSSQMTSDPTSDSSDNSGTNKKRIPYQSNDSAKVNNESDDSQSSVAEMASLPSSSGASSEQPSCSNQGRVHSHLGIGKLRSKNLPEARPRRNDRLSDDDSGGMQTFMDTDANDIHHFNKPKDFHGKLHESKSHSQGHDNYCKPHLHGSAHIQTGAKLQLKAESCSEVSDLGYGTQQENQESTSSNEEDTPCLKHQKPQHMLHKSRYVSGKPNITPQERKELHRKKLVKRSRANTVHMKALLQHTPSDDDVANLLKEFTVDFLLRGYGCLVDVLHGHLLSRDPVQMDTSHFFWLVTYFLKFATELELDLEHISSTVLTMNVVSYLTYEGLNLYEELQMSLYSGRDLRPCIRRMHLVITSIREFIQTVEAYRKINHLTEDDRKYILKLQLQIAEVQDLRGLFVLLLQQFNSTIQSQQFLQDLVVTNHNLLLFVDNASKLPQFKTENNLVDHMRQFGTVEIMRSYGLLLEDFETNGEFVNDCILTMMHHVAGDLSQVGTLFQPSILRSLSRIWETDFEVCDDWTDLIEYVIQKFVDRGGSGAAPSTLQYTQDSEHNSIDAINVGWNTEDTNNLYWYYQQSCDNDDPIGSIVLMYELNKRPRRSRIRVIQQLLQQDVITDSQYKAYLEAETMLVMTEKRRPTGESLNRTKKWKKDSTDSVFEDHLRDEIILLKDQLTCEGNGNVLGWLQRVLLEACYVKLRFVHDLERVMEPIPHICTRLLQSIPLVPWYPTQRQWLQSPTFMLLLHKLGLHLAGDAGKVFPRIPHFWTPDVLFQTAEKLGHINESFLKFNPALMRGKVTENEFAAQDEILEEKKSSSAL